MTDDRALLESQLNCLRQAVLFLGTVSKELSLDPGLTMRLDRLSAQLPARLKPTPCGIGIDETLEILPQARACFDTLAKAGYLGQHEGDGLASTSQSTLDELETALGKVLRERTSARLYGLYVLIDPAVTRGRDPLEVARGALSGGAITLQLRDKLREKGQTLPLARALKELCAAYGALFIVNDHADLAAVVEADGLHIGQGDLPVAEARQTLRAHQIVGRSNHLSEEVMESQTAGADYLALGPIYPTATSGSANARGSIGPEAIANVKSAVTVPVVAIGGINEDNVEPVIRAGADAVCVTSAVGLARDPEEASLCLVQRIHQAGGKG